MVLVKGTPEAQQAIVDALENWPGNTSELTISVHRPGIEWVFGSNFSSLVHRGGRYPISVRFLVDDTVAIPRGQINVWRTLLGQECRIT